MLTQSSPAHQTNLFGMDLLLQLDPNDPLLKLCAALPWHHFEKVFSVHDKEAIGAPSKPIRLMVEFLPCKQLESLSDEAVVLQWKRNPYYQFFCGLNEF